MGWKMNSFLDIIDFDSFKVLSVFCISQGSKFQRNVLKDKTGIPNLILDRTLARLINLKILIKEKYLLSVNFSNFQALEIIKLLFERYSRFKQISLNEYFIISYFERDISFIKGIGEVYLFGSYAKLTFSEKSDIDIAIVAGDFNKKIFQNLIKKLEEKYGKKFEIHYFSKEFYNNRKDPLVKEILTHGIKLL